MNLVELVERYLDTRLNLSKRYRSELKALARRCSAECGAINGSLPTQDALLGWLRRLADQGRSPATLAAYRRMLRAVLNWGAEQGLCPHYTLPVVRVPKPLPDAWTVEEVSRIIATATTWPGKVGRHLACKWWPALLLTCYYSGARIGSIMAAEPFDWNPQHMTLTLRHTKSGAAQVCRLHAQAAEAIARIYDPLAARLFEWPYCWWHLFVCFRRIVAVSGIAWPSQV